MHDELDTFIGRLHERHLLNQWAQRLITHTPHASPVMLVEGPLGVGRRRLLQVTSDELRRHHLTLLHHNPDHAPFDTLLEDLHRQLTSLHTTTPRPLHGTPADNPRARPLRLIQRLLDAARERPIVVLIPAIRHDQPCCPTLCSLIRHIAADRTRSTPARIGLMTACSDDLMRADPTTDDPPRHTSSLRATLSEHASRVHLKPLPPQDVQRLINTALPKHARPDDLTLVCRLTQSLPLHIVELSRTLLLTSHPGKHLSSEHLQRLADPRQALRRRFDALSPEARATLHLLHLAQTPLPLDDIRALLPEQHIDRDLLSSLRQGGFLTPAASQTPSSPQTWTLRHELLRPMMTALNIADTTREALLTARIAAMLHKRHNRDDDTVEAAEVLLWARRAGHRDTILSIGESAANHYARQQRWTLATQCLEWTLDATRDGHDNRPPTSPRSQTHHERLCHRLITLYTQLTHYKRAETLSLELLRRWADERATDDALLQTFLRSTHSPPDEDFDWTTRLQAHPRGRRGSPEALSNTQIEVLARMIDAAHHLNRPLTALHRCAALLKHLSVTSPPGAWVTVACTLRALLQTPRLRASLSALHQRLIDQRDIFSPLSAAAKTELLNSLGELIEADGHRDEALNTYERAAHIAYHDEVPAAPANVALEHIARLYIEAREPQVALHYLKRADDLAAARGDLEGRARSLRRQVTLFHQCGQPIAALMTAEEAHRLNSARTPPGAPRTDDADDLLAPRARHLLQDIREILAVAQTLRASTHATASPPHFAPSSLQTRPSASWATSNTAPYLPAATPMSSSPHDAPRWASDTSATRWPHDAAPTGRYGTATPSHFHSLQDGLTASPPQTPGDPPCATSSPQRQTRAPTDDTAQQQGETHDYAAAKTRHSHELVMDALKQTQGNKSRAAKLLGITRQSLYRILAKGAK